CLSRWRLAGGPRSRRLIGRPLLLLLLLLLLLRRRRLVLHRRILLNLRVDKRNHHGTDQQCPRCRSDAHPITPCRAAVGRVCDPRPLAPSDSDSSSSASSGTCRTGPGARTAPYRPRHTLVSAQCASVRRRRRWRDAPDPRTSPARMASAEKSTFCPAHRCTCKCPAKSPPRPSAGPRYSA